MKSRWDMHRGVRIFYFDLSNFSLDDAADAVIYFPEHACYNHPSPLITDN